MFAPFWEKRTYPLPFSTFPSVDRPFPFQRIPVADMVNLFFFFFSRKIFFPSSRRRFSFIFRSMCLSFPYNKDRAIFFFLPLSLETDSPSPPPLTLFPFEVVIAFSRQEPPLQKETERTPFLTLFCLPRRMSSFLLPFPSNLLPLQKRSSSPPLPCSLPKKWRLPWIPL